MESIVPRRAAASDVSVLYRHCCCRSPSRWLSAPAACPPTSSLPSLPTPCTLRRSPADARWLAASNVAFVSLSSSASPERRPPLPSMTATPYPQPTSAEPPWPAGSDTGEVLPLRGAGYIPAYRGAGGGDIDVERMLCSGMRGTGFAGDASAWLAGSAAAWVAGDACTAGAQAARGRSRGVRRPVYSEEVRTDGAVPVDGGEDRTGGIPVTEADGDSEGVKKSLGCAVVGPRGEAGAVPLAGAGSWETTSLADRDRFRFRALEAVSERYDLLGRACMDACDCILARVLRRSNAPCMHLTSHQGGPLVRRLAICSRPAQTGPQPGWLAVMSRQQDAIVRGRLHVGHETKQAFTAQQCTMQGLLADTGAEDRASAFRLGKLGVHPLRCALLQQIL